MQPSDSELQSNYNINNQSELLSDSQQQSSEDPLQAGTINFKNDITIIQSLKFQNTIYKAGEHISLRTDPNEGKQIYGKILLIGKVPQAVFPLVYIAWHYSKFQGFSPNTAPQYLSDKQLVASNHKDWQYIESITRKIKVVSLQEFQQFDQIQRDNPSLFFMRSYMNFESEQPIPLPRIVCHCLKSYNPDQKMGTCIICNFDFHPLCAKNQQFCINCQ